MVDRSPGPPSKFAQVPSARCCERIQRRRRRDASSCRMPRNWRSSRSSASMVTLVRSSPFHQPAACCRPSRWSRARAAPPRADVARQAPRYGGDRTVLPCRPGYHVSGRDELGDRGQLGPDVTGQVDAGQARVGRGELSGRPRARPSPCRRPRPTRSAARTRSASVSGSGPASRARSSAARQAAAARRRPAATSCRRAGRTRTGLPVTSGSPQMPSRSSTSWNASPTCAPNPASAMASVARRAEAHGADAAGAGQQRGGLVAGHVQALVEGHVVALLEREVRGLPADQPLHRRGQAAGRPGAREGVVLQQHVLGQREQRVAGEDGRADAEHDPGGRPVPALDVASMMSSCSSEKLCTSSTATAAGTPRSAARRRPARTAPRARAAAPCRCRCAIGSPAASRQPRW